MSPDAPPVERLIAPRALLLGVAVSFLACCAAGFLASRRNPFRHVERFHQLLSPEALFSPTASQVRRLALSRVQPDQVAVVIGGSSILHGTGQKAEQVWTRKLQALLGERYRVLNFGFRCASTPEFGAVAAEVLGRDHEKLILVTDLHPGFMDPDPDGHRFKQFFWDAYYKGLLLPHPERDRRLAGEVREARELERTLSPQAMQAQERWTEEQLRELRDHMRLDSALYFEGLWNAVAYDRFCSVWTPLTRGSFTRARKRYPDNDPGAPPLAVRYAQLDEQAMALTRGALIPGCARDAAGHWVEDPSAPAWADLERATSAAFPEVTRPRTLLLVLWFSPFHLGQLTPDERGLYAELSRATVRHLGRQGFTALEVGEGYSPDDYRDRLHLTESGGAKMAAAVATQVREMARRLGYVD